MDYIERFFARDFFCIREADIALTPMHAFIGPNDSGKSTILRAVRTLVNYGKTEFTSDGEGWKAIPAASYDVASVLGMRASCAENEYGVVAKRGQFYEHYGRGLIESRLFEGGERRDGAWHVQQVAFQKGMLDKPVDGGPSPLKRFLARDARLVHANPEALKAPSPLAVGDAFSFLTDQGAGLSTVYDAVMNRGDESIAEIRGEVRKLFPAIKSVGLKVVKQGRKELQAELKTGEKVPAQYLSEGLLYYLLFACLKYLDPAAVLLVEEPENGLHPARIADVMRVLREISRETQVLIATHNPLVINELQPEEVSIVIRPAEKGTQVIPMNRTRNFDERAKAFALGELWLSYADGKLERELVEED